MIFIVFGCDLRSLNRIAYPGWTRSKKSDQICQESTGCCPKPLAITSGIMLPASSLVLMNISHLRCGPVGVRFTRLLTPKRSDGGQVESRFAGRHKWRPYKELKRKFLYCQVTNLEQPHCVNCIWATACRDLTPFTRDQEN